MTAQTLILDKGRRKYVFRYTPGSEGQVMDQVWRLADDGRTDLDWLDAATLVFGIFCQAGRPSPAAAGQGHQAGG